VDAASCRVAAAGSRCHFFAEFRQNISKQALKHEFSEIWQSREHRIEHFERENASIRNRLGGIPSNTGFQRPPGESE